MYTKSAAYAVPLPSPFNRSASPASETNQYVIQLTIPSSSATSLAEKKRVNGSVILWAGVGRLKGPRREGMNEYERALAEEMEEPTQVTFEGSRKLGQDFACAIPSALVRPSLPRGNALS